MHRGFCVLLTAMLICLCLIPATVSAAGEYSDQAVPSVSSGADYAVGQKTIGKYLLAALAPVGKVLYVWGGGWNDSTRIGIPKTMTKFYNSRTSSYDYKNYNDLSSTNRAKGFDSAGYVGWCTYQVMHSTSNEGSGYTVVSGEIGPAYKARGWGQTIGQDYLSSHDYILKPGDIGYNDSHCFIVVGQCKDKSVVILHSTPQAGVQISGTTTPDGDVNSEAQKLAAIYMKEYAGTKKYTYQFSVGNYIKEYIFFRWNRSTLADPDGYMNQTADEILKSLFKGEMVGSPDPVEEDPPVPGTAALPKTGDKGRPLLWLILILAGLVGVAACVKEAAFRK